MISVVQQSEERQVPLPGGKEMSQPQPKLERQYQPIGVLYAKAENGVIEFVLLYETHVDLAIKAEIAERFGVGSREWKP